MQIFYSAFFSDILIFFFFATRKKTQAVIASEYRPFALNAGPKSVEMS
jgi:hypothetical protein